MKIIIEGLGFPQIKGNCPYPHSSQNKGRVESLQFRGHRSSGFRD